ncbi:MAG: pantoate--beta-alanine ligase [Bacteroidota bacterium]|nr:pantoate--beta-alanine ligase [Bacteroidota bacterium]
MKIIKTVDEIHSTVKAIKLSGKSIGLVPTMGFLHRGHISLVKESKIKNDITIVSVFVNPTQFGPTEDLNKYPRDIDKDTALLEAEGVDYLFLPDEKEIYPDDYETYVEVTKTSKKQEGEFRPSHFKGVTTIVSILFNCVCPDNAYFGRKDAQQAVIIKKMVKDLKMDINVVIMPIIREDDGLALSSRNIYLNKEERERSLLLSKSLNEAKIMIESGEHLVNNVIKKISNMFLKESTIHLNYIRIVEASSFNEIEQLEKGKEYYILIAARIGTTRLIDNLLVTV